MGFSFWPFILSIVFNFIFGMIWYSPRLLGKSWALALGFDLEQLKPRSIDFLGALVVNVVSAMVIGILVAKLHIKDPIEATQFAMLVWVGFIVTTHFSGVIWAKKPMKVYFIDVGFLFITTWFNTLFFALID